MRKLWSKFWKTKKSELESNVTNFWNSEKWEKLKANIKIAIKKNINEIQSKNSDLYAYAILPGAEYEVNSLVSAYNNLSDLENDETYYKYSVDEWKNYDTEALQSITPLIAEINKEFISIYHEKREDFYLTENEIKLIEKFHTTILSALKELKRESNLFNFNSNEGFVVIWIADSDSAITWNSVKELNSKGTIEEFHNEFN